jgi:hypothetical protein
MDQWIDTFERTRERTGLLKILNLIGDRHRNIPLSVILSCPMTGRTLGYKPFVADCTLDPEKRQICHRQNGRKRRVRLPDEDS